jgi:hypothetical protein
MQETMWLQAMLNLFSPEITTRVTGNESLPQRNAVFVKSEKRADNTFMRALK